ncbi:hypothetical protein L9W92_18450 [Pelotomaculum terephthalicicum JT]|uniref:hypothetical protein n=1 Tax=Pelotomaculum terephthalicicum TaxID=206393 RepID=UPI0009C8EFB0|nr:hypothetical protein [Pelotomaculum terephthalicicum]MCG9969974.1 hypothetical protein [Pelotomaculum terephthalicicum JT]OPX90360.1 MAG: hypothetical protein A4E53_01043 [Pelotomaculum sp. PtaB.Bin104]OPY58159.1 MAG: hypothetical protein A4E56_03431 [Pelotomaculum sp. PtaU1.Bin065]
MLFNVTEEQFVKKSLNNYKKNSLTKQEFEQLKYELAEDYRDFVDDYKTDKECQEEVIRQELRSFYNTFFNAPENLTVVYKGKIIQGKSSREEVFKID